MRTHRLECEVRPDGGRQGAGTRLGWPSRGEYIALGVVRPTLNHEGGKRVRCLLRLDTTIMSRTQHVLKCGERGETDGGLLLADGIGDRRDELS